MPPTGPALQGYKSVVNQVADNLRNLLPPSTSADIQQRITGLGSPRVANFGVVPHKGIGGGLGNQYSSPMHGMLTSYKGGFQPFNLQAFQSQGPLSYQQMLAQNQFTPHTTAGDANIEARNTSGSGLVGVHQWDAQMKTASQESDVPWEVLASIMGIETQGQNLGANSSGAVGLMQVVPHYWQNLADQFGGDLTNPLTNIRTAAAILRQNYEKYGSWEKAAAAYFGGDGAFNSDGSYSTNSDSFGTNIQQYVDQFDNYMGQLGYGQQTPGESANNGNPWTAQSGTALQNAMLAIGVPYVFGGETMNGFDCSGLVEWAYAQAGKQLPRTAQEQFGATQRITGDELQPGDLIFFTGTVDNGLTVTHVAIYMGNGQMIQAPKEGDIVKITPIDDWWRSHIYGYGRVT